jgi:hypothetical protein
MSNPPSSGFPRTLPRPRAARTWRPSAGRGAGAPGRVAAALHHRAEDGEHDEDPDHRSDDPAEVEDSGVADAEADGEDQVAEGRVREADEDRDAPSRWAAHVAERIVRHERATDHSGQESDDCGRS